MSWYTFFAYNSESSYGYGSEADARLYTIYLNTGREHNLYSFDALVDSVFINDLERNRNDGFNIADSLSEI